MSTLGLGYTSNLKGSMSDQVVELVVATARGDILTCNKNKNEDLFNAVRNGLGQFGIILTAKFNLQPRLPFIAKVYLVYDNIEE